LHSLFAIFSGSIFAIFRRFFFLSLNALSSPVERGSEESMWDLVTLLDKERDPELLFRITDALETYYYKERYRFIISFFNFQNIKKGFKINYFFFIVELGKLAPQNHKSGHCA
jgi:hypothetical protein